MKDFRKLEVWRKAHVLALDVYRATRSFPREELYGLTSQLRRAAAFVPTNIAEGCGRETDADFRRMLTIAAGSASEAEYLLMLSAGLGFLSRKDIVPMEEQVIEIKRMLTGLAKKLKADG